MYIYDKGGHVSLIYWTSTLTTKGASPYGIIPRQTLLKLGGDWC